MRWGRRLGPLPSRPPPGHAGGENKAGKPPVSRRTALETPGRLTCRNQLRILRPDGRRLNPRAMDAGALGQQFLHFFCRLISEPRKKELAYFLHYPTENPNLAPRLTEIPGTGAAQSA